MKTLIIFQDGFTYLDVTSKAKEVFNNIYKELSLSKTGKGTDISSYYDIKDTKKTINGKSVKGFIIIRSKVIFN